MHVFLSGNQTDDQSLVVDPPDGKIPYQPWARAKRTEVLRAPHEHRRSGSMSIRTRAAFWTACRGSTYQGTFQILQPAGYVVIL